MTDVMQFLAAFRAISSGGPGNTRLAYTECEDRAQDFVWEAMRDLDGIVRCVDAAGNLFVVHEHATRPDAGPVVLMGSHVDTVIEGGWLDGALGVAVAMHAVRAAAIDGAAHPQLGLVVFRDEEGVRFNTGLFGSRVFAGLCDESDLSTTDRDGTAVRDVVPDPQGCLDYRPPVTPAVFLECHIEQGLRLELGGDPIGVVTGMVGIRRLILTSVGEPNHAGTTGMRRRVDALTSAAGVVARLPELVADRPDAVITCGRMHVAPGAPNVVPGHVEAIIEIRAQTTAEIDAIEALLRDLVAGMKPVLADGRLADMTLSDSVDVQPTAMDEGLMNVLEEEAARDGASSQRMASMAGHDAQHAAVRCPAGMFFIPSIKGISHSPEEDSRPDDIERAARLMGRWAMRVLESIETVRASA